MGNEGDYVLRALRGSDAAAAAELIRLAFASQSVATDPPPSALHESAASVATALTQQDGAQQDGAQHGGFGAQAPAVLVGVVLWRTQPDGLHLGRLAVHPDWRGHGIARLLISSVETAARTRGVPRLVLSTRLVLHDNRRLFAACGFRETQQHAHPGYAHPTFIDMEKLLG